MDETSFEKAVSLAKEKELESAQFYANLSRLADSDRAKQMFEELATEERRHYSSLEQLDPEKIAGARTSQVTDLKISEYMHDIEFHPDMTYQEILILAMKSEEKAKTLYAGMAEQYDDQELRTLFEMLARAETAHKLRLETEYDEFVLTED